MRATRHASRWLAVAGALALGAGLWTPATAQAPDPVGNNGTIKIDGIEFDSHPNNEPHVSCEFQVDFYGFDEGELYADVEFRAHPPTGNGDLLLSDSVFIGEDAAGGGTDLDAEETYDLTDALSGYPVHVQGQHVKLTVHAEGSQGADTKHKVFWVGPCGEPPEYESSLRVSKEVTGTLAPDEETVFSFALSCSDSDYDETFGLTDGTSILFGDFPLGTECTLTETATHGGNVTYRVDGVVDPPPVTFTFTEADHHIEVEVTNDFPYIPPYIPPAVVTTSTSTTTTSTTTTTVPTGVLPTEVTQAPSTVAPATTAAPAEVEGVQLPRTGGVNTTLLLVGSLLVLQGVALEVSARRLHRS